MSPQAWCAPCKTRGRTVVAHRLVPGPKGQIPKCSDCFAGGVPVELTEAEKRAAQPAEEETPAPLRTHPVVMKLAKIAQEKTLHPKLALDWTKIQNERSAGVPVAKLAEKYGCHITHIYTHTKAPKKTDGRATRVPKAGLRTGVDDGPLLPRRSARPAQNGAIGQAIAELEAKRTEIDHLIEQLRRFANA